MTFYLLGIGLFWSVTALLVFIVALRSGQWEDVEGAKFSMMAKEPELVRSQGTVVSGSQRVNDDNGEDADGSG